jgi:hypothetical protein
MPKLTKKYSAALDAAYALQIQIPKDQETLYELIEKNGHQWDSDQGAWIDLANEPAEDPTPLLMVRVWADAEIVEEYADLIELKIIKSKQAKLIERSKVYLCRPPKQLEGRIYLKFMPTKEANDA